MQTIYSEKEGNLPASILENILAENVILIDVRTPMEFIHGHLKNARNIPFETIPLFIEEFKKETLPFIVCSANGCRSAKICQLLRSHEIDAYSAGNWETLRAIIGKA